MNTSDVSMVARRDDLITRIQSVLEPQLKKAPLSVQQHVDLQVAIANFTVDLLKEPERAVRR